MVQSYHYDLMADGNRQDVLETQYDAGGANPVVTRITWGYDNLNRLTRETRDLGDNLTQEAGDYIDTYTMDLVGNRVLKIHDEVEPPSGPTNDKLIVSAYTAQDQLLTEDAYATSAPATISSLTLTTHTAYTYDLNGSTVLKIQNGQTTHYVSDLKNYPVGPAYLKCGLRWNVRAVGDFLTMDNYQGQSADPRSLHKYLYCQADPVNSSDPTGRVTMLLGTKVHQYLCRDQFELGAGAVLGSMRWGNRWVSTIINEITGTWAMPNPLRPDMVEVYGLPVGPRWGDVYELKPGPIQLICSPDKLFTTAVNASNHVLSYMTLLSAVPAITWDLGASLWPTVKGWPGYPDAPLGTELVTFNMYSIAPGMIFYDFLPSDKARKIIGLTVAAAAPIVGGWTSMAYGGAAVVTVGGLVIAQLETILAVVGIKQSMAPSQ